MKLTSLSDIVVPGEYNKLSTDWWKAERQLMPNYKLAIMNIYSNMAQTNTDKYVSKFLKNRQHKLKYINKSFIFNYWAPFSIPTCLQSLSIGSASHTLWRYDVVPANSSPLKTQFLKGTISHHFLFDSFFIYCKWIWQIHALISSLITYSNIISF